LKFLLLFCDLILVTSLKALEAISDFTLVGSLSVLPFDFQGKPPARSGYQSARQNAPPHRHVGIPCKRLKFNDVCASDRGQVGAD
jgi:hypothetical protein